MPDLPYLFTYGTLRRGFKNPVAQQLHAHSLFIDEGFFHGLLYQVEWYPGAIFAPDSSAKVYGEVFQLTSPEILRDLDEYEDLMEDEAASLYLRKKVPVHLKTGGLFYCWTYIYNQPVGDLKLIETGIFIG
ncbi:gamma-glutamylcyclotransferase family protein [Dyadobacter crusticola]|uniref:gamma-glutamylcyclotransferase family protein n=1 Tax=Dyadobacter crusticola TaxID=292407 RepID=UPI0004E2844B|nr:gamma-glutamylcyclotransferase family protein [Dyadobacter crusticola]